LLLVCIGFAFVHSTTLEKSNEIPTDNPLYENDGNCEGVKEKISCIPSTNSSFYSTLSKYSRDKILKEMNKEIYENNLARKHLLFQQREGRHFAAVLKEKIPNFETILSIPKSLVYTTNEINFNLLFPTKINLLKRKLKNPPLKLYEMDMSNATVQMKQSIAIGKGIMAGLFYLYNMEKTFLRSFLLSLPLNLTLPSLRFNDFEISLLEKPEKE